MSEGIFGGLRKIADEVTGKAAQRRAEETRQQALLQAQKERQAREEAKQLENKKIADRYTQVIASAVKVDHDLEQKIRDSGYPPKDVDLEKEVANIESTVKARAIFADWYDEGLKIKGRYFPRNHQDIKDAGDTDKICIRSSSGELPYNNLLGALYNYHSGGMDMIRLNHPNGEDSLIEYTVPTSHKDKFGRPTIRQQIYFLLPKVKSYELFELVRSNPIAAKRFLEKGLGKGEPDSNVDPLAIQDSSGVRFLHLDMFDPTIFNPFITPDGMSLYQDSPKDKEHTVKIMMGQALTNPNKRGCTEYYSFK